MNFLGKILKDLAAECEMREQDKLAMFIRIIIKMMPKRIESKG
jgi:hypothetical protein